MGSAIGLREDFDGAALRRLSRTTKSTNQARRLLALAEIYDGGTPSAAARIGCVGLQIVRDWVLRFNARGPEGLLDGTPIETWFQDEARVGQKNTITRRWGKHAPPFGSNRLLKKSLAFGDEA